MPDALELRRAMNKARKEQDKRNEEAERAYFAQLTAAEEAEKERQAAAKAEHDRLDAEARQALLGADEPDEADEQKALGGAPENKAAGPKSRKRHK